VAQRANLRASDADRERVAERLRTAATEGRLFAHELEERMARALRARTYGELDAVVSDLPGSPVTPHPVQRVRPRSHQLARQHPMATAVLAVTVGVAVVAVMAAIVISFLAVWGVWMIIGWFVFGRRHSHGHHHGNGYGRPGGPAGRARIGGPGPADHRAGTWV
jgi:hypothetical protein